MHSLSRASFFLTTGFIRSSTVRTLNVNIILALQQKLNNKISGYNLGLIGLGPWTPGNLSYTAPDIKVDIRPNTLIPDCYFGRLGLGSGTSGSLSYTAPDIKVYIRTNTIISGYYLGLIGLDSWTTDNLSYTKPDINLDIRQNVNIRLLPWTNRFGIRDTGKSFKHRVAPQRFLLFLLPSLLLVVASIFYEQNISKFFKFFS